MSNQYVAVVHLVEDSVTGDIILPLPQEVIDSLNWKPGDELSWDILPDGSISITLAK